MIDKRGQLLQREGRLYPYEEEAFGENIYWVDEGDGERCTAAMSY
ncbi:hypothetical protein [Sphingomonas carotinifaciens]|nr:hypothetical protein [Sphingomonas carotinifaciens]